MGEPDWKELGLMSGIEIHQQLGRPGDKKLFCNCPADIVEREPDMVVTRNLRASAGETGSVDVAASAEQAKQKRSVYHAYDDATCLVEIDEEPPHPVNKDVVETAVMVAKLLKSTILPRVQFMRKTIIDGSNVSGFQRTGLFAVGGTIPGLEIPVGIQTICIEEEAAKIVSRSHDEDVYNLSRLGIPLLEIATAPDMKTPEQVQVVAAQLGMILRSTGRVKRGLGTIRQDVNVSITGGRRCEIKGAQDLRMVPTIVKYEALRQQGLLAIKEALKEKELKFSDIIDVTREFKKSEVGFVQKSLGYAIGFSVRGLKGLLGKELCPGYRLGTELAGIAKSWGFGGIIHSDEPLDKYGVSAEELTEVFGLEDDEAFIVLLGNPDNTKKLFTLQIIPRLKALQEGVPQEVRKANQDGTTSYLRPVPGAARMYPETDIPIVTIHPEDVETPKLITEQVQDVMKETGLSKDLVTHIITDGIPIKKYKEKYTTLSYAFLSSALVEWPREIASRLGNEIDPPVDLLLQAVHEGTLAQESVKAIYERMATEEIVDMERVVREYAQISEDELKKIIDTVVTRHEDLRPNALMGIVMKEVKGRADGKLIMKLLQERST